MPSFRSLEKIELGPRQMVRFWHSNMIRICAAMSKILIHRYSRAYRTSVAVVDREGESREKRNNDAAFEWCPFSVSSDDPVDDGVANLVLYLDFVYHRTV